MDTPTHRNILNNSLKSSTLNDRHEKKLETVDDVHQILRQRQSHHPIESPGTATTTTTRAFKQCYTTKYETKRWNDNRTIK